MAETNAPKKSSKRFLIGCGIGLFLCILLGGYIVWEVQNSPFFKKPSAVENVAPDQCPFEVPQSASNVSFMTPAFWGNTAYEFDISEAGFISWAKKNEWPIEEIESEPVEIHRYVSFIDNDRNDAIARVINGLGYTWTEGDRGIYVAYDRDKGRAYFMQHTR